MSTNQATLPEKALFSTPLAEDRFELVGERIQDELKRLAAVNKELMQGRRCREPSVPIPEVAAPDEITTLRAEYAALKLRLEAAEHLLDEATKESETWASQQKEYEALLEEKTEVIRDMHHKLAQHREAEAVSPAKGNGQQPHQQCDIETAHAAAEADAGQIEVKEQLEEQRQQLERDEQALMAQMRQMEMAMSRERADLARQRSEIQRLHAELTREIEMAARDPGLREKLLNLQRTQQAILTGSKSAGMTQERPNGAKPATPKVSASSEPPPAPPQKSSGFLRRMFGK